MGIGANFGGWMPFHTNQFELRNRHWNLETSSAVVEFLPRTPNGVIIFYNYDILHSNNVLANSSVGQDIKLVRCCPQYMTINSFGPIKEMIL